MQQQQTTTQQAPPVKAPDYTKPIQLPNFFILGAAKSGTTSLYHYLRQHPDIFLPKVKEPTFFCETYQAVANPIKYFELFDGAGKEQLIGEGSHAYLSDPKAGRVLKALFPQAKFIVIFRNPAERAFSLYQHMRRQSYEPITSFEEALRQEDDRFNSSRFRKKNSQYFYNFLYYRSGLFGAQMKRFFTLFDREQFHLLTLDELKGNFQQSMQGIWSFLEVDPIKIQQKVFNKGYTVKSERVEKLLNARAIRKLGLHGKLTALNHAKPGTILPETKEMLMRKYRKDQDLLHSLTGIRFD